jgi:conjugal transfer/entry exclusion protein
MTVVLVLASAGTAPAQFVVIDPANLQQTILIAERTFQHYEQLRRQYEAIQLMARRLGNMDAYRIPTIPMASHDPTRWTYGRTWIQALNSGDPRGTAYFASVLPLQQPSFPARLSPTGRQALERAYATIEIADSIASMGAHQVALVRGYHGRIQDAVEALERDVTNPQQPYHEMTAVLDKVAAGELLARRQDMAGNQLLSHALEQLLARSKRERDTEAATINMQLTSWRDGRAANEAFVSGSADALRTWRQP